MCGGKFLALLAPNLSEPAAPRPEGICKRKSDDDASIFWNSHDEVVMDMRKVSDTGSTANPPYSYTSDIQAKCRPQRAMDGLNSVNKQEP